MSNKNTLNTGIISGKSYVSDDKRKAALEVIKASVPGVKGMVHIFSEDAFLNQMTNLERDAQRAMEKRPLLEKQWAFMRGLKKSKSKKDPLAFLGVKSNASLWIPGQDHISLWNKNGRPFCVLSQPYISALPRKQEVEAFCKKHSLNYEISKDSFWFPGRTASMIWTRYER